MERPDLLAPYLYLMDFYRAKVERYWQIAENYGLGVGHPLVKHLAHSMEPIEAPNFEIPDLSELVPPTIEFPAKIENFQTKIDRYPVPKLDDQQQPDPDSHLP